MKLILKLSLLLFCLITTAHLRGQDSIKVKKSKIAPSYKMNKVAQELKESLDKGDESTAAKSYEDIAQGFIDKGNNKKAEEYLKKAISGYAKLNLTNDQARVTRLLAKVQESQNKVTEAISNYEKAEATAADDISSRLNSNDANRLRNVNNPIVQADYSKENLEIIDKKSKKQEVADIYVQQAQANLKLNDNDLAIKNFEKAIDYSRDKPLEVAKLTNEITKVYTENKEFDKALKVNNQLLVEAQKKQNIPVQIKQLQALSNIYFEKQEASKGVELLKESYDLAVKNGNTAEVKKSLGKLLQYFRANKNDKEALKFYDHFFNSFDTIIARDSSLIDTKIFQATEDKIKQLEKEKLLKDELINRKSKYNYMLIASIFGLLLFLALIAKALYSIKTKNKEIALQSLRREMNPHFIFNSLNSVNQFISQNKELEANKYLTSYSTLMRNIMENSNKDFVSLTNEIEQLKKYLDLEHLRFQDKFDYSIVVEDTIDTDIILVPNMILQPHLENAIWHGLRYKSKKGHLELSFQLKDKTIYATIIDDGIGLKKSLEIKTQNQKVHESRGLTNIHERIKLLNDLYKTQISFNIEEINEKEATGTKVTVIFPILAKI